MVEQACVYQDMDGLDVECLHVLLQNQNQLLGYCRLVPPGLKYREWSIGRVITALPARGKGLGHDVIKVGLAEIERRNGAGVRISAQSYLKGFYEGHGFVALGDPYLEDGIPHIEMLREKAA